MIMVTSLTLLCRLLVITYKTCKKASYKRFYKTWTLFCTLAGKDGQIEHSTGKISGMQTDNFQNLSGLAGKVMRVLEGP